MIHWELCLWLKFDHADKPESILENETHKIVWDFEIQTDHQIRDRKPDQVLINKKKPTCRLVGFTVPEDHKVKIKGSEKTEKYFDLAGELKKL